MVVVSASSRHRVIASETPVHRERNTVSSRARRSNLRVPTEAVWSSRHGGLLLRASHRTGRADHASGVHFRSVPRFASGCFPTPPHGAGVWASHDGALACGCLWLAVATNSPREGLSAPIQCPCQAHLLAITRFSSTADRGCASDQPSTRPFPPVSRYRPARDWRESGCRPRRPCA